MRRKTVLLVVGIAVLATMAAPGAFAASGSSTITTVAGTGDPGFGGDGGPATSAQLYAPYGLAVDGQGNVYIADTYNNRVRKMSGGTITTVAGTGVAGFSGDGGQATSAQLDHPRGVAVDGQGDVFIADTSNNRVRKLSGGTITTIAGSGVAGFSGDGGPPTAAQLNTPYVVAVDGHGNVYIADSNNSRVRRLSGGTITTVAGTGVGGFSGDGGPATSAQLTVPDGLALDVGGNLYIADRDNHRVRKLSGGTITTVAGTGVGGFSGDGGQATSAQLNAPSGVAVDGPGNVYIADTLNYRVRRLSGGAITTVAGTGVGGFSGDGGQAASAQLARAAGVAADAGGNLYLADTLNDRVREVANVPPIASFTASQASGPAPLQVSFEGSGSSDADGSIASFAWNFGDGSTGTGATTSHTYTSAGSFTAKLTVQDNNGATGSATQTVAVATPVPAPAPSPLVVLPTAPGRPAAPRAYRGHRSAVLTWTAPATGGSKISGYRVVASPGGRACTTTGGLRCTVTGLVNGRSYRFTVAGSNAVGVGARSAASAPVVPAPVPGVPARLVTVRGNGRVALSWTAPAVNGTPAISGYRVVASPGGRSCTATASVRRCTVTGLVNGRRYQFTVVAINRVGAGPPAAAAAAVPATTPSPVRALTAAFPAVKRTVLSWSPPAAMGGLPLVRYEFRTSTDGGRTWSRWTSVGLLRTATITGWSKARHYLADVRAVTRAGAGSPARLTVVPTR